MDNKALIYCDNLGMNGSGEMKSFLLAGIWMLVEVFYLFAVFWPLQAWQQVGTSPGNINPKEVGREAGKQWGKGQGDSEVTFIAALYLCWSVLTCFLGKRPSWCDCGRGVEGLVGVVAYLMALGLIFCMLLALQSPELASRTHLAGLFEDQQRWPMFAAMISTT